MQRIFVSYAIGNPSPSQSLAMGMGIYESANFDGKHWQAHEVHNWNDIVDLEKVVCIQSNYPIEKYKDVTIFSWKMVEDE